MITDEIVANLHKQIEEMAKMFAGHPEERTKFMIRAGILDDNGNWIDYSKQRSDEKE